MSNACSHLDPDLDLISIKHIFRVGGKAVRELQRRLFNLELLRRIHETGQTTLCLGGTLGLFRESVATRSRAYSLAVKKKCLMF